MRAVYLYAYVLAAALGCTPASDSSPDEGGYRPMTDAQRREFQASWGADVGAAPRAARPAAETAVTSGPAPLAYIAQQPADVWVTDDTGRRWGPVFVGMGATARVAAQTGIAIGPAKLAEGPLATEGRTYAIHVGSPADTGWQNRAIEGPKPKFTPHYVEPRP